MANSHNPARICLACNEDGFGPSAFGYYLARELIDAATAANQALCLTVLNRSAVAFNRQIYHGRPQVKVESANSLVRLSKPKGEVHVPQTLALLRDYSKARTAYADLIRRDLEGCAIAIDIGVPLFTRAARELGIPHRITVFDHSWAATLRLIASEEWGHVYRENPRPGLEERAAMEDIARRIEEDESTATALFLFEHYITPDEFVDHWRRLGVTPQFLPGVLGLRTDPADARAKLESTLVEYGQGTPQPDKRLVLVSPGGTPVWDDELPKLLEKALDAPEQDYVLVLSKDLGQFLIGQPNLLSRIQSSDRIRYYGPMRGATQQAILPAFDRVITRAGGGMVNDALAAHVKLAFVEEPQVQVKLIERECARIGIHRTPVPLEHFRHSPWECIDALAQATLPDPRVYPPAGAEQEVVRHLLSLI